MLHIHGVIIATEFQQNSLRSNACLLNHLNMNWLLVEEAVSQNFKPHAVPYHQQLAAGNIHCYTVVRVEIGKLQSVVRVGNEQVFNSCSSMSGYCCQVNTKFG